MCTLNYVLQDKTKKVVGRKTTKKLVGRVAPTRRPEKPGKICIQPSAVHLYKDIKKSKKCFINDVRCDNVLLVFSKGWPKCYFMINIFSVKNISVK